ncbi:hypothetical protein FRC04_008899 [Tulasnella sp. 424]|nr:hypothetical protein FRC04_008899 [Tulasnella sp. 424]
MDVATVSHSRNHPQPLPSDSRHHVPATPDRPSSPAFSEWATRSVGRRSSTLPYTQQGIKEPVRRRSSKATRWLLMVFPPEVLSNESSAAASSTRTGRSTSGILMPLQSTVSRLFCAVSGDESDRNFICQFFAQLTAIAREFELPSTIGLCMYLQIVEGPQSFNPRMSDESWQILWSPYLSPSDDTPPPSPAHGFPIAGRIEFDIDMVKAKWYAGWVSGTLRHVALHASHRGESSLDSTGTDLDKTKSVKDQDGEASESTRAGDAIPEKPKGPASVASGSTTQRAPRPLSLLNRRGSELPAISAASVPPRLAHYALESGSTSSRRTQEDTRPSTKGKKLLSHHLSPIPQVDTPPASSHLQKDVNALVHEWRKSSASIPTAVLATSPAQPNSPPAPTEDTSRDTTVAEEPEARTVIDLADFDWSVSSRGPVTPYSPADGSPVTAKLARSIHLAERTYGSVILTPSTQTSWGPGISPAVFTPVSNASRYPSPDIAARMIEDSPCTPTTATSWGPSSSCWASSPVSQIIRLPSPDIAARMIEDAPCTPSTATSWGPSSACWASSPVSQIIRLPSPDIAARMIEDAPCTPSTATTWGPPLSFPPTPAHYNVNGDFYRLPSPDIGERSFDESKPKIVVSEERPSRLGWPYFRPRTDEEIKGARLGWPYFRPRPEEEIKASKLGWPFFRPSEASMSSGTSRSGTSSSTSLSLPVTLPRAVASYPVFDLYPPAYPHLEIYPDVSPRKPQEPVDKVIIVALPRPSPAYPDFDLYPAGYPNLVIYPGVVPSKRSASDSSLKSKSLPVALPRPAPCYPDFDLYPAGYPNLVIYPDVAPFKRSASSLKSKSLPVALPRPAPCYPDFDLYPAGYPNLVIYPDVMPFKRSASNGGLKSKSLPVALPRPAPCYPDFDLYPAGYPNLVIYPDVAPFKRPVSRGSSKSKSLPVALPRPAPCYPHFDLYPAGYPNLEIYPAVTTRVVVSGPRPAPKPISVRLAAPAVVYPEFNIYPATYPALVVYPSVVPSRKPDAVSPKSGCEMSVRLPSTTGYPIFDLYPAVYPELVIYPALSFVPSTTRAEAAPRREVFVSSAGYPTFDLYPAVYPWVTPYPPCLFQLARPLGLSAEPKPQRWVPRKTHKMLHDEWFAAQTKRPVSIALPPPPPPPTIALPALPEVSPPVAPAVRSRARSGTVVRPLATYPRGQLPPPPPLQPSALPSSPRPTPNQPAAPVPRSREELHALIFGGQPETSAQDIAVSPVAETASPITAIAISPTVERAPLRRSPSLSPPGGIRVGLPSHPGAMVPSSRKSVAERRATFAMQQAASLSLARSNTSSKTFPAPRRSLTVLAEGDDAPTLPKSPRSPLSRSVSLSRMKTNDDLFKKRQSLLNSPRRRDEYSRFESSFRIIRVPFASGVSKIIDGWFTTWPLPSDFQT